MSNLDGLHKRIDKMLAQERERQLTITVQEIHCIRVRLPIKDDEPPVGYQRGSIYFYVPENRWQEEESFNERS